MLFQPIEETSRNLFAQLCASDPADKVQQIQKTEKSQQKDSKQHGARLLQDLLKLYALVSLVAFSIGPIVAPILLRIVAGSMWADTEASDVLAIYCYYIPLLAVNGVTEAFVAATASNEDLYYQSFFMGVFFAGFAGSAYFFLKVLKLGAQGLVWSNCVNMAFRILFNVRFVKSFFGRNEIVSVESPSTSS
jgi:oligosaccharide translocation protein RFT1